MTEPIPSNHEKGIEDNVTAFPTDPERLDPRELPVSAVVRQFLSEGLHPHIGRGEPVADYVLHSLTRSDTDEWAEVLQTYKLVVDDAQFDNLSENDEVFQQILSRLRRTIKDTPKGERMSTSRRALMELMELRAGEYLYALGRPDTDNETAWERLLQKLVPSMESEV